MDATNVTVVLPLIKIEPTVPDLSDAVVETPRGPAAAAAEGEALFTGEPAASDPLDTPPAIA